VLRVPVPEPHGATLVAVDSYRIRKLVRDDVVARVPHRGVVDFVGAACSFLEVAMKAADGGLPGNRHVEIDQMQLGGLPPRIPRKRFRILLSWRSRTVRRSSGEESIVG
jgi:hypothetical protein